MSLAERNNFGDFVRLRLEGEGKIVVTKKTKDLIEYHDRNGYYARSLLRGEEVICRIWYDEKNDYDDASDYILFTVNISKRSLSFLKMDGRTYNREILLKLALELAKDMKGFDREERSLFSRDIRQLSLRDINFKLKYRENIPKLIGKLGRLEVQVFSLHMESSEQVLIKILADKNKKICSFFVSIETRLIEDLVIGWSEVFFENESIIENFILDLINSEHLEEVIDKRSLFIFRANKRLVNQDNK